jgi:hypothetical protein
VSKQKFNTKPIVWTIIHPELGGPLDVVANIAYESLQKELEGEKAGYSLIYELKEQMRIENTSLKKEIETAMKIQEQSIYNQLKAQLEIAFKALETIEFEGHRLSHPIATKALADIAKLKEEK